MDTTEELSLRVVVPKAGFVTTFIPYNDQQQDNILDHVTIGGRVSATLKVQKEWVLASGHSAMDIALQVSDDDRESEEADLPGPMRLVHRHRRRTARRRWPGWRERVLGQVAALLPPETCGDVHALQRAMVWASRGSRREAAEQLDTVRRP